MLQKPPIDGNQNLYHKSHIGDVIEKTYCLICSRSRWIWREMMSETTHLMMSNCTPLDMKTPIIKVHKELRDLRFSYRIIYNDSSLHNLPLWVFKLLLKFFIFSWGSSNFPRAPPLVATNKTHMRINARNILLSHRDLMIYELLIHGLDFHFTLPFITQTRLRQPFMMCLLKSWAE